MKKLVEAIKKFIISVSPNNLAPFIWLFPKEYWTSPISVWIRPNMRNKPPIPAVIHVTQFNVFNDVFIGLSFVDFIIMNKISVKCYKY